jgi:hypothetical protein
VTCPFAPTRYQPVLSIGRGSHRPSNTLVFGAYNHIVIAIPILPLAGDSSELPSLSAPCNSLWMQISSDASEGELDRALSLTAKRLSWLATGIPARHGCNRPEGLGEEALLLKNALLICSPLSAVFPPHPPYSNIPHPRPDWRAKTNDRNNLALHAAIAVDPHRTGTHLPPVNHRRERGQFWFYSCRPPDAIAP